MKTSISIPDALFHRADQLAKLMKISRSELCSHALSDYVERHDSDAITEVINRVCDEVDGDPDSFVEEASRRTLERTE